MDRRSVRSAGQADSLGEPVRVWVRESCAAQGLPVKVADRQTLANVARLLGPAAATPATRA